MKKPLKRNSVKRSERGSVIKRCKFHIPEGWAYPSDWRMPRRSRRYMKGMEDEDGEDTVGKEHCGARGSTEESRARHKSSREGRANRSDRDQAARAQGRETLIRGFYSF